MNKFMCKSEHNPPESYGDCIRACVATLIDDDSVPHFFDQRTPEESWDALRKWMIEKHGKTIALFSVPDVFENMAHDNHSVPFMLMCRTVNGFHAVVCKSGEIVHDPAHNKPEIIGPYMDKYWLVGVVVCSQ